PELFSFLISAGGHRVFAERLAKKHNETFQTYLVALALSYAFLELGIEKLHATCVLIDGSAAGFLGESGPGKSTIAGSFIRNGHPLLTDDMLVLRAKAHGFDASPGLPQIKLFPPTAQVALGNQCLENMIHPRSRKAVIPLGPNQFHQHDAPLKVLYV